MSELLPAEPINQIDHELIPIGTLFSRSWGIFKKHWKSFFVIQFLPALIFVVVFFILVIFFVLVGVLSFSHGQPVSNQGSVLNIILFILFSVLLVLLILAFIYFALWQQLALLEVISHHEEKNGFKNAFAHSRNKIVPYFYTGLLTSLFLFAGYAFFVIPGLVLSVWFSFAGFIVMNQGVKGLRALITSRGFVRGYFWPIVGRFVLFWLVQMALFLISASLVQVAEVNQYMLLAGVIHIASSIVGIILNFIGFIYAYLIYEDLRDMHGNFIFISDSTRKKYMISAIVGVVVAVIIWIFVVLGIIAVASLVYKQLHSNPAMVTQLKQVGVTTLLESYKKEYGQYPDSLKELNNLSRRQSSRGEIEKLFSEFSYQAVDGGHDYVLCSTKAGQVKQTCVDSNGKDVLSDMNSNSVDDDLEESSSSSDPSMIPSPTTSMRRLNRTGTF